MFVTYKNCWKVSGIYKITNIVNNKFYIGSTTNLYRRICEHRLALSKNKHSNQHLQNAYNKYGIENFKVFVLESNVDLLILRSKEGEYLQQLKPEYNIADVDVSGKVFLSKETKIKIGAASAQKFIDKPHLIEEFSERARKTIAGWNAGLTNIYSDVQRKNLSDKAKDRWSQKTKQNEDHLNKFLEGSRKSRKKRERSILQFDSNNLLLKEWSSISEACAVLKMSAGNIITGIQQNKIRYGYYWKYKIQKP